jgi:hypothetical protein
VGDFNGDGVQDLAVANAGSDSVSVLLGEGMARSRWHEISRLNATLFHWQRGISTKMECSIWWSPTSFPTQFPSCWAGVTGRFKQGGL